MSDSLVSSAFSMVGEASFAQFLAQHRPDLLGHLGSTGSGAIDAPHGTTIVAATWAGRRRDGW